MAYSQRTTTEFWKIIDFNFTYDEIREYGYFIMQWEDDGA